MSADLWRASRAARRCVLAGLCLHAAATPAVDPPAPFATDPQGNAFDAARVGYEGVSIDLKAVDIAYEPIEPEIARWQDFIAEQQRNIESRAAAVHPSAPADVELAQEEIAVARNHVAQLQARERLYMDSVHCGLDTVRSDWLELTRLLQEQTARIEPVAAQSLPALPEAGAAGDALVTVPKALMLRILESDRELLQVAESHLSAIDAACRDAKRQKDFETYKQNLEAAHATAKQTAAAAQTLAARGRFDDVTQIAKLLTIVLQVARADQLMGDEERGLAEQQWATEALQAWARQAAASCQSQSFKPQIALQAQRQLQMLGADTDFAPCMSRLFESAGLAGFAPFRARHCGTDLSGDWSIEVTTNVMKLTGQANIPDGWDPASFETLPAPQAGMSHSSVRSAAAPFEASGVMRAPGTQPTPMHVSGTVSVSIDRYTQNSRGLIVSTEFKMRTELKMGAFVAIPQGGGLPTPYPGNKGPAMELPVAIVNGNRPCDPSRDVWTYPEGP